MTTGDIKSEMHEWLASNCDGAVLVRRLIASLPDQQAGQDIAQLCFSQGAVCGSDVMLKTIRACNGKAGRA
jgi:hypothetical protein